MFRGGVAVVGGGTMGQGIATALIAAGLRATVVDVDPAMLDRARATVERRLRRRAETAGASGGESGGAAHPGSVHPEDVPRALSRLSLATDLAEAVSGVDAVIEAVPEILDLKRRIFRTLASSAPETALLASNTSTMSVGAIAEGCGREASVVGMHFFNPAHRMPLVEVIRGDRTAEKTLAGALALAHVMGKDPIVVRDVPGFVTSRLGLLLGTEAMRMVDEGVAPAADIDKAMRLGYGHPMGPLELADLVGLDVRLNNLRSMAARSALPQYQAPEILERLVAEGRLGKKSGHGFYDYDETGRIVRPAGA